MNLLKLLANYEQKNILIQKIIDYSDMQFISFNKESEVVYTNTQNSYRFAEFTKDLIDQLKWIIEECIILTDTYYISEESVQKVLANEGFPTANITSYLDLHKPLM